jgi:hypothetical protein
MRRLLTVALTLLLAPPSAHAKRKPPPAPEVVVVAKLVERSKATLPHCGILHVAEAMRYEIIMVERGKLTGKTLWVAHGCPAMPRTVYNGKQAGTLGAQASFIAQARSRSRATRDAAGSGRLPVQRCDLRSRRRRVDAPAMNLGSPAALDQPALGGQSAYDQLEVTRRRSARVRPRPAPARRG